MPSHPDHDAAQPRNGRATPLVKVQRWYHLRRLFVFDFGWHTKDFRLVSITETAPDEFTCTFKPRYYFYRKFLPLLLGRPETMPPHCLNRMISRCLYAIMRDRCRVPGRTWGIAIDFDLSFERPIRIDATSRVKLRITLDEHRRSSRYDGFRFRYRTEDGSAVATAKYGLLDEPGHDATRARDHGEPLPELSPDIDAQPTPRTFPGSWLRRHSMFEMNHGWQLKEYRPKFFEQIDRSRFIISFRPRYRLIRRLAPLLLRRPERMAIDCSVRMLERTLTPVLRLSGRNTGAAAHEITAMQMHCRSPITVQAGRQVPLHLELEDPVPSDPVDTFRLRFTIGDGKAFEGLLVGRMVQPDTA